MTTSLVIVTYHAIAAPGSTVSTPAWRLERDLDALAAAGASFVSLDRCADWLEGRGELPSRPVAVTFDDGYLTVLTEAVPILARRKIPATVFVIAGRLGRDNQWPGQPASIPSLPLVDEAGVRTLADSGLGIGCHSWSHARLTELSPDALDLEFRVAADRLEQVARVPVRHFAYPYGIRGSRETRAAAARFRTGLSAESRAVTRDASPHDLGRLDCHDLRLAVQLGLLGSPLLGAYLGARRRVRALRRRVERAGRS